MISTEIFEFIKDKVLSSEENIILFRRILHKYPELSMEEYETTERICEKLDEFGIQYRKTDPTGVIAEIKGANKGKTLLLRADIDALPIQEQNNNLDYRSVNDNIMHACGHDTHTAMLLYAVPILASLKHRICGNIRFVFQPAEEIGAGAKLMIDQGVLENVDNVFGIHINSAWDNGVVNCPIGESMAASAYVKIIFKGQQCHAARPHQGVDAIQMASIFCANIQSMIAKEINSLDPFVFTIGKFHAGHTISVVAPEAILEGSIRAFNLDVLRYGKHGVKKYAKYVSEMFGGSAEVEIVDGMPPLINDRGSSERVHKICKRIGLQIDDFTKKTGSEDFAFYTEGPNSVPGVFIMLGARSEDLNTHFNHHTERFNIDESQMKIGTLIHVMYALDYLGMK